MDMNTNTARNILRKVWQTAKRHKLAPTQVNNNQGVSLAETSGADLGTLLHLVPESVAHFVKLPGWGMAHEIARDGHRRAHAAECGGEKCWCNDGEYFVS